MTLPNRKPYTPKVVKPTVKKGQVGQKMNKYTKGTVKGK